MINVDALKAEFASQAQFVEDYLEGCLKKREIPAKLLASMEYSLLAGGKRLRPVLCLATAEMFGVNKQYVAPFAAALEMIHTYSLIHDDLPCMDNDDLRRGRPTNHKAFDEATALLGGDGLLTDAFWLMTESGAFIAQDRVLTAIREAANAAGAPGMVGGQMLDMEITGQQNATLETLQQVHALKTGAMIRAACLTGALLGGADEPALAAVARYGTNLGLAFQIVDDILDVVGDAKTLGKTPGKDAQAGKLTYPALIGLEGSRSRAAQASEEAVRALGGFSGPQAEFLSGLPRMLVQRVS